MLRIPQKAWSLIQRFAQGFRPRREDQPDRPPPAAAPQRPRDACPAPDASVHLENFSAVDFACQHTRSLGAEFYYCITPKLALVDNPSDTELLVERSMFQDLAQDGSYDPEHWITTNPVLFANALALLGCSPEEARSILTAPTSYTGAENLLYHHDHASPEVNIQGGFRVTTPPLPGDRVNTVHVFGASTAYSFGCTDGHTIPSLLQARINDRSRTDPDFPPLRVLNHGLCGCTYAMSIAHLLRTRIRPGDVVLLFDCKNDSPEPDEHFITRNFLALPQVHDLCINKGIPVINTQPYFERPHPHGEVFVDTFHLAPKGNAVIADRLFEICLLAGHRHRPSAPAIDERLRLELFPPRRRLFPLHTPLTPEIEAYLDTLRPHRPGDGIAGAVLMNSNPFTLGHRHLLAHAASQVDRLFVFVVTEDTQFFSFQDRIEMVRRGAAEFANVTVLPYTAFQATARTHQAYFAKERDPEATLDASDDLAIFGEHIAPLLGITRRFFGHEPLCPVTRQYNQQMHAALPIYGIRTTEIPRHALGGGVVSASVVRRLLGEENWSGLRGLVPESTYRHLVRTGRIPGDSAGGCDPIGNKE